jgi:hypothetical protein
VLDFAGEGSGKSILIKGLRVRGPGGLKLAAKGSVVDLKDYAVKLQVTEGKLPLETVAEFIPQAGAASGTVEVQGEAQGSLKHAGGMFARLSWTLRGVSAAHGPISVKRVNGSIETILGTAAETAGEESSRNWLARIAGVSGQWAPAPLAGEEALPVQVELKGNVGWEAGALTGELSAKLSELNLVPWLRARTEGEEKSSVMSSLLPDLKRSKFKLRASAPLIRTPYLDFAQAEGVVALGSGEVRVERVAGRALEGDLALKGSAKNGGEGAQTMRFEVSGSGQDLSMTEVSKLVSKVSGKNLEASFFGRGDVEVQGSVADGLPSADFSGRAEVREGGFKFLPLPKKVLDELRRVPKISDRLPLDRDSGTVSDKFEKAVAKFALKGDRLDLEVETVDAHLWMTSKGHITLGGHCELSGTLNPNAKLVGETVARYAQGGIPFTASGDSWACPFRADFAKLVEGAAKTKIKEEIADKVGKVKELFGK